MQMAKSATLWGDAETSVEIAVEYKYDGIRLQVSINTPAPGVGREIFHSYDKCEM